MGVQVAPRWTNPEPPIELVPEGARAGRVRARRRRPLRAGVRRRRALRGRRRAAPPADRARPWATPSTRSRVAAIRDAVDWVLDPDAAPTRCYADRVAASVPTTRRGREARAGVHDHHRSRTRRRTSSPGVTSACDPLEQHASAASGASACSAATCSRRVRLARSAGTGRPCGRAAASGLSAGRRRCTRPPRNSNSGLMPSRRPAQPAMPGHASAAHEVVEARDRGDQPHALDHRRLASASTSSSVAPARRAAGRGQHHERLGAGCGRGVDDAYAVAELTGGDRRRLVRAAHAGSDRQHEQRRRRPRRDLDGRLELTRRGAGRRDALSPEQLARAGARLRVRTRRRSSATSARR